MRSKKKKIISDQEIQKDLKNIYEDKNGKIADISRLEPTKKRGLLRFLIILGGILLLLVIVAWAGFFVFNKYAPDQVKKVVGDYGDVELKIEAPKKIDSGDEIIYVIKYKNKKRVALNDISLNVRYPSGLLITNTQPAPEVRPNEEPKMTKEDNWSLGTLAKGESGEIEITGRLLAEADSNQNLWVILYYEPANFTSQFQKEASWTTVIEAVPIELSVEGVEQLITSDQVGLTLKYTNQSEEDINNVLVEVDYPEGFDLESIEPEPVEGSNNQWSLATLDKNEEGEIKLDGKFAANVAGNQDFIIKIYVKEGEEDYYLLAELTHTVTVVTGTLTVELKVNGSNQDGTVNFGDTLNYSLTYQNNGEDDLEDLEATVFFTPSAEFIEWTSLNDRYDGFLDEFEAGKILTWTKEEVPNLDKLEPGEKGVIDFSIRISSAAGELAGDLSLQSIASIKIGTIDEEEVNVENKSNKIITKLNSNLNLIAQGRYFDASGTSIGSGPLPPRVGQTTRYIIVWQLTNSVHEVRDIVVSATLPESVTWSGQKDITAGSLEYQENNKKVIWALNRMPLNLDLNYQVRFEVSVTPETSDLGKVLALTGDNNLTAVDYLTNAKINQVRGSITTDLIDDSIAKGKGLVEE